MNFRNGGKCAPRPLCYTFQGCTRIVTVQQALVEMACEILRLSCHHRKRSCSSDREGWAFAPSRSPGCAVRCYLFRHFDSTVANASHRPHQHERETTQRSTHCLHDVDYVFDTQLGWHSPFGRPLCVVAGSFSVAARLGGLFGSTSIRRNRVWRLAAPQREQLGNIASMTRWRLHYVFRRTRTPTNPSKKASRSIRQYVC